MMDQRRNLCENEGISKICTDLVCLGNEELETVNKLVSERLRRIIKSLLNKAPDLQKTIHL